jgi:hypothetical protein
MYFPDNFAGLMALSEHVRRFVSAVVHRHRMAAPQTAGTFAETSPKGRGLSPDRHNG